MLSTMKSIILLIFFLGLLVSCHKDTDIITIEDKPDPTPVLITTKLVSQNNTTSSAATSASQVFAGNSEAYNHFPYIVAKGNLVNRDFELVRLETQDHLEFYHVTSLVENDVNYHHWKKPEITYFLANSAAHHEISLASGYILFLPANSILYSNGSTYTGTYKIAYALLDPLTSAADAIPSYTGIQDHQHVALQFQECIYINVLSESGEKLQFSESAYLQIPPTSSQQHWKFDSAQAAWVPSEQINSEIRLGSTLYYGMASASPAVRVTGTFKLNGKFTPHHEIQLSYGNTQRRIFTTNSGTWAAIVPSEIICMIETSLPCESTFTHSFNSQKDPFNVSLSANQETCVNTAYNGTMRNNVAEALNGIIVVSGEHPNFYYADDLDFNFNVPTCLGNITGIQGIDIATGQSGPVIYWEAADSIDMLSVFACEEANYEYMSLEVSGEGKMYWDLQTRIDQSRLIIEEGITEQDLSMMILISGMEEGDYQNTDLNIVFEDKQLGSRGYSLYCPTSPYGCGFTKFVITHFTAQQSQWIRGYFEGLFWIKTFNPLTAGYRPVKGEFQVFRDF